MGQRKFRQNASVDLNPIEAIRDIGASVVESTKNDLGKEMLTDLWDQMLGTEIGSKKNDKISGDLKQGEEINLNKKDEAKDKKNVEAAIDYTGEIIHAEKRIRTQNNQELDTKVQEIIIELKNLANSSKELEATFKEVTVQQKLVKPGKYHLNFFEWMLTTIRSARQRIEDSSNWANLFASKKTKREYWSLFKKHGTSFGLSGERVVATQTG